MFGSLMNMPMILLVGLLVGSLVSSPISSSVLHGNDGARKISALPSGNCGRRKKASK